MSVVSRDTSPDAQATQDAIYRRMGGAERVAIQLRLSASTRALTLAGIQARHPDYSEAHARLALARILFGDELVREVWPGLALVAP